MLEIAAFLKTDVATLALELKAKGRERKSKYMIERLYEVITPKLESKLVLFYYLNFHCLVTSTLINFI
jgi:hypothetical protein